MKYANTCVARFVERPNRFIARVERNGETLTVHVKNTGRCRELLIPGAEVVLTKSDNPNRKTRYDLIAVKKPNLGWVNIDSQAPNVAVKEWLQGRLENVRPETVFGQSRLDFSMEKNGEMWLLEVKGCTLEVDGVGYFPDAPSERAVKHLHELTRAVKMGYRCAVAFVIQMEKVFEVRPNTKTDPAFAAALQEAKEGGVEVWFMPCTVSEDEMKISVK